MSGSGGNRRAGLRPCALMALAGAFGPAIVCAGQTAPASGEPPAPREFARPELLAQTSELTDALGFGTDAAAADAKLVVLDARPKEEFAAGHLPGARHLDSDSLQDPERKPYYLPAPDKLAALAAALGLNPDSRLVVYDANDGRRAARAWLVFWTCGLRRCAVLNGGYAKWLDEQRPVTAVPPPPAQPPGTWKPSEKLRGLATIDELLAFRAAFPPPKDAVPRTLLLDARTYPEYKGEDLRASRGGHVPGAVNLPYESLLAPQKLRVSATGGEQYLVWREPAEIHALLRAAGLVPGTPLMVYDQAGGRAAHLFFSLQLMGYDQAACYLGGWREYGERSDLEVEK